MSLYRWSINHSSAGLGCLRFLGANRDDGAHPRTRSNSDFHSERAGLASFDLTKTKVLEGFGFSIEHPPGWSSETIDDVTRITELPTDLDHLSALDPFGDPPGYEISFQYVPMGFLQVAGLP